MFVAILCAYFLGGFVLKTAGCLIATLFECLRSPLPRLWRVCGRCDSCAVVSTSGSLLGSTDASKIIDAADTVFRVNFAPTTSFDQFVGRATDVVVADALLANYSDIDTTALRRASAERHGDPLIIIHSPESAAEFASMQKRIETVLSVRALALSRSFEQMAASLVSTEAQVLRLTVPCMAAAVDRDLCRPSSSLVAALLAIARCRESVTLFGFANPRMHSASRKQRRIISRQSQRLMCVR
jgi:hypothetical protein